MFNKKGGVELSLNFIVVLIISLVLFGFGIKFSYDLVTGVQGFQAKHEARVQQELENLVCESSDQVCLPFINAEVRRGERTIFGLKIVNTKGTEDDFTIDVSSSSSCFLPTSALPDVCLKAVPIYNADPFLIEAKSSESKLIGFNILKDAAQHGTYIFNVVVKDSSGTQHGPKHKIYIKIP
tara:strand:- start:965 stop:1507 length:543 start_codon:yes stop_codon:yes gene_type:complete